MIDGGYQVSHRQKERCNGQSAVTLAERGQFPAQPGNPGARDQSGVERRVAPSIAGELLITALPIQHHLQPSVSGSSEDAPLAEHAGRAKWFVHVPQDTIQLLTKPLECWPHLYRTRA